jgi:predicted dinucleotide-binding enzyme
MADRVPGPVHRRQEQNVKIGILGAGMIGGTLTRRLTALGHQVSVANSRGPETLADLAAETGATAVWASEVADGAEVVVVTVPEKSVPNLPGGFLKDAADGAVVIDTGNYYPQQRDGRIAAIEDGLTESEWVAQQIGHPVVKVFNGIYFQRLLENGQPTGTPGRIALPLAGDSPADKAVVARLVEELGFDPVDAGPLSESWRQEPGRPVYGGDFDADGVRRALAEVTPERPAAHIA